MKHSAEQSESVANEIEGLMQTVAELWARNVEDPIDGMKGVHMGLIELDRIENELMDNQLAFSTKVEDMREKLDRLDEVQDDLCRKVRDQSATS